MNLIEINGTKLEIRGIEPAQQQSHLAPLVFLHEGLGSVAMWRDWPQAVCQSTGRAGWVYSRQGYGQSAAVSDVRGSGRLQPDYMHQEAWTILPALLDALGVEKPVLVGHSDGGTIALLYASRHPVAACIAIAPHVMVEEVSVRAIEQARISFETGDLRQRLGRYHADVDGAFWQWNDIWLSPDFRDFDIRPHCSSITAPVLALQGEDDPYGTLAQIEQIALPSNQITRRVLAQCGHSPHREQEPRTTEAITDFLRAVQ